jgi:AcrR family transcriptional regulator
MTRDMQKMRTRRDLVAAALDLLAGGSTPTVTQVADAAGVSRRTAYRYFPSAEQLIVEALLEDMRTEVEREIDGGGPDDDMPTRVNRLVRALNELTTGKEQLLRQMVRFTIDRGQIEPGVPPRPSRRIDYVEHAIAPLQTRLAPLGYDLLLRSLAVVIGIEARIVLSDICGLDDAQILETQQWAAQALLAASLSQTVDDHSLCEQSSAT